MSDWRSDVCSSDLHSAAEQAPAAESSARTVGDAIPDTVIRHPKAGYRPGYDLEFAGLELAGLELEWRHARTGRSTDMPGTFDRGQPLHEPSGNRPPRRADQRSLGEEWVMTR